MLTLIQFPWSPFCITVRHMLEQNDIPFRLKNIPFHERASIIRATDGRGYTVPCLVDGKQAVCDVTDFGQEVARYVDRRYELNLFPTEFEGIQLILSRYIENDLEMVGFKINDSYIITARPPGRTGHADPAQGTEVREGLCPDMDNPAQRPMPSIHGNADAIRQHAGKLTVSDC